MPETPSLKLPAGARAGALRALAVLLVAALGACDSGKENRSRGTAPRTGGSQAALPGSVSDTADDGQWTMPAKDYASTRFSRLAQINTRTVGQLRLAWTFSTGVNRGHEAAPLVVNNTMYVITPFPDILYALDLTRPGAPMKWKFDPQPASAAQGVACCDVVNRGGVYADGKIIWNTLDGHTVAVDANTGRQVWKARVADFNKGESITMAPLVVKNHVFVGNSGGEFGVRGWITALDLATGKLAWRAYSTGPDNEVMIGPEFRAQYPQYRGKDLGVTSWPPDAWKIGGGTVWGWMSYDPELNLLYYGTGNPGPWNAEQRPGDNLWTSGIFARDPDTGAAHWFYQWSPHDLWDYDGINEQILLNLPIGGQTRKVMVRAERDGYVYVLDRTNGQVISANPFVDVTTTLGVDMKTGRPAENMAKHPHMGEVMRDVCPAAPGGKDWQPTAWSPRTGLVYIPHQNLCEDFEGVEANYIAGTPYVGANVKMYAGHGGYRGALTAWDPVHGKIAWQNTEFLPVWSGALVTAGDVVFYGTMDGWFKAVDARNGKLLWQFKCGSGIIGQPMTYRGPDGKQYVAILAGVGGWSGAIVAGGLDPRDSTGALGFTNAMKDLPQYTNKGGMLYVFSL